MLERLHIQGFKSLRDTTVELAPLTVVFGPNGPVTNNRHQPSCLPPDGMGTLTSNLAPRSAWKRRSQNPLRRTNLRPCETE